MSNTGISIKQKAGLGWMLLLVGLWLPGCAGLYPRLQEPTVNIVSLKLLESQGLAQRFRIGLLITNPNSVPMPINGMSYYLRLNGYNLINGASDQVPILAAYSETPVTIEASADLFAALRLLNSLVNQPQKTLEYQFGAKMDLEGWRPTVNVRKDGQIAIQQ